MIKTYALLKEELKEYKNPKTKIQRMEKNGEIFYVTRGIYETNPNVEPFFLSGIISSPSYISFETALSYYSIIPERTYAITCATFEKKKKKQYSNQFSYYTYRDIPSEAYPYGTICKSDGPYSYIIATKEKAILDTLYDTTPIANMREMREYIFENMRMDEYILQELDIQLISNLAPLYHSKNVELFEKMMRKGKLYNL